MSRRTRRTAVEIRDRGIQERCMRASLASQSVFQALNFFERTTVTFCVIKQAVTIVDMTTELGTVPPKQAERRQGKRRRLDLPLRVLIPHKEKTIIRSGRGTDVGEGGMAVFVGAELRIKDEIFVEFTPPFSSDPLRVRAIVRGRKGYNYGVEFVRNTPEEEVLALRFIDLLRLAAGSVSA